MPSGERRQLTVLFCDLVGSTPFSQQLDAEEWRDVVVRYQHAARTAVERWGGHVAKELGDGLLVYFGWPTAREDDSERAMRAGLTIIDALQPLNAEFAAGNGTRLSVRIGMHTGPVVIADGGEVFGETPNVAARVQAAAEPDTVVVTAATQRLAAGIFVVEERGPQVLKGVREPVVLYRVVRPSGMRSRLDVAAERLTPFVGREMELGALLDRWERVTEGHGQNVLVVGEAGVGKSRLAWELRARLKSEAHTWLECSATPYTLATPLFPVIELVAQGLAFAPEDSAADKIAKLERGLAILAEPLAETLPVIARLLGIEVPAKYPQAPLVPDVERQRTLEILSAWNLALGEVQAIVLLVEDLHWCDATSLALLGRIVEQSATARVLLLGTARPEFAAPWPARSNLLTLSLARFTKRQARAMVNALGVGLASETVEALIARGDGVPLYLEELTKTVAESGAARTVDAIPATLADSLMARLDRLSTAKEVAQRAAVLGREFPYALLASIGELDEAALRQGLARLVEAEILFVRGAPPAASYRFKHALVQEAAYESLLKRTRQRLHASVCAALAAHDASAEPEILAQHAELAGRLDEALTHLERAARTAQERSAHAEAARHFERAIGLLSGAPEGTPRDARTLALLLDLGATRIISNGYGYSATRAAYERALALGGRVGDRRAWAMAQLGIAVVEFTSGGLARGHALATEVFDALAADDSDDVAYACASLTATEHYLGSFESSLRHAERAVATLGQLPSLDLRRLFGVDNVVSSNGFAAWSLALLGRFDAALAHAARGVAYAQRCDHPFSLAYAHCWDAVTHRLCGDHAGQRDAAAACIAIADRFRFPFLSGVAHFFHGLACLAAGEEDAMAEMLDGLSGAGETGNQMGAAAMLGMLADAQRRLGLVREARSTLNAAIAMAAQSGERNWEPDLLLADAEIAAASGAPLVEVVARLDKAQAVARELDALRAELCVATTMARALRDAGQRAAARTQLAGVYAKFTEGFDMPLLVEAKSLLSELST